MNTNLKEQEFIKSYKFINQSKKLTLQQKLIINYILSYQEQNQTCFASNNTIANEFGLHRSCVIRHIRNLKQIGILQVTITKNKINIEGHTLFINIDLLHSFLNTDIKEEYTQTEEVIENEIINKPFNNSQIKKQDNIEGEESNKCKLNFYLD